MTRDDVEGLHSTHESDEAQTVSSHDEPVTDGSHFDSQEGDGHPEEEAIAPMQSILRQFRDEFDRDVRPLVDPLREVTSLLAEQDKSLPITSVLPDLRDLQHQLQGLIDKVAEQQAYVLIFGPLKSGKSTFMNAMCGSYVSEVTALPAYPCLVHVSHSDQPDFMATHYDGRSEKFESQQALYDGIEDAHRALTDRLRELEAVGEDFDPAVHMPGAVRRIDVKLPTRDLSKSGAVLVDTPGLYSRMKFGYDRMTRDFRDAAACAIFVVKTDNLFLEQVFNEFTDLLDLFSRIFLIVNLDATKQDLKPDGSLAPSLEHEDPSRIIEAFKDLAMSGPLREAADQGRLSIYPVDLLRAASERIQAAGAEDNSTAKPGSDGDAHDDLLNDDDQSVEPRGQTDFETLRTDLTEYLNSNEYLKAFLADSLRRGGMLLDELDELLAQDEVVSIRDEVESLRQTRSKTQARAEAIARLNQVDWRRNAEPLRDSLTTALAEHVSETRKTRGHALVGAIDSWFETDDSLEQLNQREIRPLVSKAREGCVSFIRDELKRQMGGASGGIAASADVLRDALSIDIELGGLARESMEGIEIDAELDAVEAGISSLLLPVRRGFWDWLLMRSRNAVRQRLFGPADNPDHRILPAVKSRRLGDEVRQSMHEHARHQLDDAVEPALQALPDHVFEQFVEALTATISQRLQEQEEQTSRQLKEIDAKLAASEKLMEGLSALSNNAARGREVINDLQRAYVSDEAASAQAIGEQGYDDDESGSDEESAMTLELIDDDGTA